MTSASRSPSAARMPGRSRCKVVMSGSGISTASVQLRLGFSCVGEELRQLRGPDHRQPDEDRSTAEQGRYRTTATLLIDQHGGFLSELRRSGDGLPETVGLESGLEGRVRGVGGGKTDNAVDELEPIGLE